MVSPKRPSHVDVFIVAVCRHCGLLEKVTTHNAILDFYAVHTECVENDSRITTDVVDQIGQLKGDDNGKA
jgi:hypothetical protein